jgi:hypothetical protein
VGYGYFLLTGGKRQQAMSQAVPHQATMDDDDAALAG